jgi:hypothetical protein
VYVLGFVMCAPIDKVLGLTQKATPERGNELLRRDVNPKRGQGS